MLSFLSPNLDEFRLLPEVGTRLAVAAVPYFSHIRAFAELAEVVDFLVEAFIQVTPPCL